MVLKVSTFYINYCHNIHEFGSIGFGTVALAILVGIINKQVLKFVKKLNIIK